MAEIKCNHCGAICDETIHDGRCLECDEPFCSSPSAGSQSSSRCGCCGLTDCVCGDDHFEECVCDRDRDAIIHLIAEKRRLERLIANAEIRGMCPKEENHE